MQTIKIKQNTLKEKDKSLNKTKRKFKILIIIILVMFFISMISKYIAPNDPNLTNTLNLGARPCLKYPFGSDNFGRCVFSRVLVGARTSIFVSIILVIITFSIGTTVGVLAGYYGGFLDLLLMRITDIFLAFPELIIAIAVAGVLGGGLANAMIALIISGWTQYARIGRSQVLKIKEENFIKAAVLSGNSNFRIIIFNILPNIISPLVVTATLQISSMMISLASLSFLGIGVKLPEAEWGSMISEGSKYLRIAPWIALLPSLVMIVTIIIFNLFGDTYSDLIDPEREKN